MARGGESSFTELVVDDSYFIFSLDRQYFYTPVLIAFLRFLSPSALFFFYFTIGREIILTTSNRWRIDDDVSIGKTLP